MLLMCQSWHVYIKASCEQKQGKLSSQLLAAQYWHTKDRDVVSTDSSNESPCMFHALCCHADCFVP